MSTTITLILMLSAFLAGSCASTRERQELAEARSDRTKSYVLPVASSESIQAEINYRAYDLYVNGLIAEGLGDIYRAAEFFGRALKDYPDSREIAFSYARTLYQLKKTEQALETLRAIAPQDAEVLDLTAICYRQLAMPDSVRATYSKLVLLDPDNTMAYSFLAGYYRQTGNLDSVIWAYENIVRLRPESYRNLNELARLLTERGDYPAARDTYRRSLSVESSQANIRALIDLSELCSMANEYDSAMVILKQGLEIAPDNLLIHRELLSIFLTIDSSFGALTHAKKIAELSPTDNIAVRRYGVLLFAVDSLEAADAVLTALVEGGDRHPSNHFYLGRIAGRSEDWARARDEFIILTKLADTAFQSWLDLGFAYRRLGEREKEIETYRTGLSHMRNEPSAISLSFALGAAYEQSGQIESAVTTFEEILSHDPEHTQSLNYLGYMLADRGERLEYARELIAQAVKLAPNNAAYLDSYGWVQFRLGNYQEALQHLQRAVELDSDPVMFDHLGDTHRALGQMDEARQWWLKALEQQPDNEQIREKLDR